MTCDAYGNELHVGDEIQILSEAEMVEIYGGNLADEEARPFGVSMWLGWGGYGSKHIIESIIDDSYDFKGNPLFDKNIYKHLVMTTEAPHDSESWKNIDSCLVKLLSASIPETFDFGNTDLIF